MTLIQTTSQIDSSLVVVPFFQRNERVEMAARDAVAFKSLLPKENLKDFKAKEEEVAVFYPENSSASRVMALGLGKKEKLSCEGLRRAYAAVCKWCHDKKIEDVVIAIPESDLEDLVVGIVEGFLLANYRFNQYKSRKEESVFSIKKLALYKATKSEEKIAKEREIVTNCVHEARDLINGNADEITPQYLSKIARDMQKDLKEVKTRVLDKKAIEKEKMGLLLAVNRGSSIDPAFIIVSYTGDTKAKEHTVLVGKGITYDTGGLNLKSAGMERMRGDMAGAAAVLAVIKAASLLKLKINVTAVVPTTENSIDANSYKLGDVYRSYLGKTVEITNTDAEGRLVLADALAYANAKLKPTRMLNIATLTGAISIALGQEAMGLMTNSDEIARELEESGLRTYERVWRFPLFEEYKEKIQSDVADIVNATTDRLAGSIIAGMFLQEFVGNTPWAHLDIAGCSFLPKSKYYLPKNGVGVGVRLILDWLQS